MPAVRRRTTTTAAKPPVSRRRDRVEEPEEDEDEVEATSRPVPAARPRPPHASSEPPSRSQSLKRMRRTIGRTMTRKRPSRRTMSKRSKKRKSPLPHRVARRLQRSRRPLHAAVRLLSPRTMTMRSRSPPPQGQIQAAPGVAVGRAGVEKIQKEGGAAQIASRLARTLS